MPTVATASLREELLAAIQSEEEFLPRTPHSIGETGLPTALVESLVCKYLSVVGSSSGRGIAEEVGLPLGLLENVFHSLRCRQILVYSASAPLNDHIYGLTEEGRQRTQSLLNACAYVGPAPVPLADYVVSVHAQTIRAEAPRRERLEQAFADISVDSNLFADLGPAVNSGAGLFLYGAPGNGKSTLARRITSCFGQYIWIPYALIEGGQLIKLYDSAYHEAAKDDSQGLRAQGRLRPPLGQDPASDRGGRRRNDDGLPGNPPRPARQRERSPLAIEEQLRLPPDRRLRPPAHRAGGTAQPLDHPAGEPARLPHLGHGQEIPSALRAVDHLLDEPGTVQPGRRGLPAADSRTRSRSPIRTRRSFTASFRPTPATLASPTRRPLSTIFSPSTIAPAIGPCAAVIPAICWDRSRTTAATTTCRWKCGPSIWTAS